MTTKRRPCNCADALKDAQEYQRVELLWAVQMQRTFIAQTPHGVVRGRKGDYLCEDQARVRDVIKKETFERTYKLADEIK